MSDALASIARLRRLAEQAPQLGDDGAWLAEALNRYIDGAGQITLDESLGVAPERGQWPWWRQEKRDRERAAAKHLVEAFGNIGDALSGLRRYASGRGRHASSDTQYTNARTQAAHKFLHATGRVPESSRTIERAVTDDR
jgi:hypothetical protein